MGSLIDAPILKNSSTVIGHSELLADTGSGSTSDLTALFPNEAIRPDDGESNTGVDWVAAEPVPIRRSPLP